MLIKFVNNYDDIWGCCPDELSERMIFFQFDPEKFTFQFYSTSIAIPMIFGYECLPYSKELILFGGFNGRESFSHLYRMKLPSPFVKKLSNMRKNKSVDIHISFL